MGSYCEDRALDFVDIFNLDIGVGPGIDARLRICGALQAGAGASYTMRAGIRGRHTGTWEETAYGIGLIDYMEITESYGEKYPTRGEPYHGRKFSASMCVPFCSSGLSGGHASGQIELMELFDLNVSATCVFIGVGVGINVAELADFVAGIFIIDFLDDDSGFAIKPKKVEGKTEIIGENKPEPETRIEP